MPYSRFNLFALVLLIAFTASAQYSRGQNPIVFAPLEYYAGGSIVPADGDIGSSAQIHGSAGLLRSVPVFTLLPQTTPGSRIDAVRVEGGFRSIDSRTDFRFRLTGVDLEIQKRFKAASVTVLDIDKTGLYELSAVWLGIGFGPGIAYHRFNRSIEARILARASVDTYEFGRSSFSALTGSSADRRTGLFYGTTGTIIARPSSGIALVAVGRYGFYTGDAEAEAYQADIGIELRPVTSLAVEVSLRSTSVESLGLSNTTTGYGLTIRYVNREAMY